MVPTDPKPTAPESIGRYTIERPLGSGAMGNVYLAYDTRLRRRVALKVLNAGAHSIGVDTIAAAMREARAAGAIAHPNAAAVFDADEIDGNAYIVMEYVPGTPLRRFVGDASVPIALRVRWLVDIAGALAAAHAVGVVHRDVKPENVLIREDGIVKVLDFGIARITDTSDEGLGSKAGANVTWTQDGGFVGTPGYMAPEILRGQQADSRADQFGWGVLAYELLSGDMPWKRADTAFGMIASVLTQKPEPLGGDVPPVVAAVVSRALAKSPEDRFPSLAHAAFLVADFADAASFRMPVDNTTRPPPSRDSAPAEPPKPPALPPAVSGPRLPWGTLSSAATPPTATPSSPRAPTSPRRPEEPLAQASQRRTPIFPQRDPVAPPAQDLRRTPAFPPRPPLDPRAEETQPPATTHRTPAISPRRPFDSRPDEAPPRATRAPVIPPRRGFESIPDEATPPPAPSTRNTPVFPPRRAFESSHDEATPSPAPSTRNTPVFPPRRAFESIHEDTPPSLAASTRRTPVFPPRPHDPRADETPTNTAAQRRPPMVPPRRTFGARPDEPPSSPVARRKLDSIHDEPTPPPVATPRRKLDSNHEEAPLSPTIPARRRLDSSHDDPPPSSQQSRFRVDSRTDEGAPKRFSGFGMRAPDFNAAVDVQAHIAMLPPGAMCKGMFFNDLLGLAARMHTPLELALLAGIADRRYTGFRDYPMKDNMRLTVAVAATVHPRLPIGEALRRMGRRALGLVLDSHVGRTLFAVLPRDPELYIMHGPKAYRALLGFGEVVTEKVSASSFQIHVRDMPLFLETYQVGVLESVLDHCGVRGHIEMSMTSLANATVSLRLR